MVYSPHCWVVVRRRMRTKASRKMMTLTENLTPATRPMNEGGHRQRKLHLRPHPGVQ
jgi:hypothetical protein